MEHSRTVPLRALLAGAALLTLCACQPGWDNPYEREGTWAPHGDNAANLRAMADNPADLDIGQGTKTADGQLPVAAIRRLRTDKLKQLEDVDATPGLSVNVNNNTSSGGESGASIP
jgi:hypothetical protein